MSNSNHCAGRKLSFETRKITVARSIELHDTLSQFYTYFSQFDLKMDNILVLFHELLTVLSDSLF